MNIQTTMSGLRKAAIVALMIGEDASASIFKHLSEDEIETLRELHVDRAKRVDLRLGGSDLGEERLAGQPLVRQLVVRRNGPLVAPPHVPRRPVELHPGEPLVHRANGRASGQRDPEVAPCGPVRDPAGRVLR